MGGLETSPQDPNGPVYTIPRPFPINISLKSILFSGFFILKSSVESQYGMVTEDYDNLEDHHDGVHRWVGGRDGHMGGLETSPQDPNGPVYTIPRPFPINISLNIILFSGFCILKSSVESQYGMVTEDFFVIWCIKCHFPDAMYQ
jgi:hypothetical protein